MPQGGDNVCLWAAIDSFTVSLHSPNGRHMPAIRAVQGDCQWPLKHSKNFHRSCEPIMHCMWGVSQFIFRSANHTASNTANVDYVSYNTDSRTATTLGLWSSLGQPAGLASQQRRPMECGQDGITHKYKVLVFVFIFQPLCPQLSSGFPLWGSVMGITDFGF